MSDSSDHKCGGRGVCSYCGEWVSNVAYHEAHDCYSRELSIFPPSKKETHPLKFKIQGVKEISVSDILTSKTIKETYYPMWQVNPFVPFSYFYKKDPKNKWQWNAVTFDTEFGALEFLNQDFKTDGHRVLYE